MNEEIQTYIENYPREIVELFKTLRKLIYDSTDAEITEKMWAKIPSYYADEAFVRLIPFKDHINLEARTINNHKEELSGYKITPKGMLQIYANQPLPSEIIKQIFSETLGR